MSFVYKKGLLKLLDGTIDWATDTIVAIPVTAGYNADKDAHEFVDEGGNNDVIDEELGVNPAVNNYTPGHGNSRPVLSGKAIVESTNTLQFNCNDWSLVNVGGSGQDDTIVAHVIARQGTTNDTDAALIAYIDNAGGTAPLPYNTMSGQTLSMFVNSSGLFRTQV